MTTLAEVRLWGRTIGAVSLEDGADVAAFQYTPEFAASGIEVSPIVMPLGDTVRSFPALPRGTFHGLPGLLADSLPDRFGNALIDAWLATQCCDMQVVSETARFADTHVKVGLVAGDGGSVIWPLLIGPNRAKEMLMCAKIIYGKEAATMGLVNHSVPADQVMAKSMEIAKVLRSMPPMAVKWTKVSINKMIKDQFNLVMDAAIAYEMCSMVTQDRGEAIHAFLEKRKPEYKGY